MVEVGLTVIDVPLPAAVPPQLAVYHCQLAPVPSDPPTTESVVLLPEQMVVDVAEIEAAGVERSLTVMVTEAQVVVLQVPSARTK